MYSRLSRALHSKGRAPDSSFLCRYLVVRQKGAIKTGSRTIEALSKTDINKTQSCRPNIINGAFSYHGTASLGPKRSSL